MIDEEGDRVCTLTGEGGRIGFLTGEGEGEGEGEGDKIEEIDLRP